MVLQMNKDKLILKLTERMDAFKQLSDRDYMGGLHSLNELIREVKYWKEAIERGEFD